jgi:7-carboxy-7-deazaguanine synthase
VEQSFNSAHFLAGYQGKCANIHGHRWRGEPLIQEGIHLLLELLAFDNSLNVEIETNGSVEIKAFTNIQPKPPVFTADYKLESSNMESEMIFENFNYLKKTDTVKFVAGSIKDLEKTKYIVDKYKLKEKCST